MRRAFMLVTAALGSVIGWGIATVLTAVAASSVALAVGTAVSALFVGSVFDELRPER